MFLAGTVTGAPIRAMQLINHLKEADNLMLVFTDLLILMALNTAITIRTMIVKPQKMGNTTLCSAGAEYSCRFCLKMNIKRQ